MPCMGGYFLRVALAILNNRNSSKDQREIIGFLSFRKTRNNPLSRLLISILPYEVLQSENCSIDVGLFPYFELQQCLNTFDQQLYLNRFCHIVHRPSCEAAVNRGYVAIRSEEDNRQ